VVHGISWHWIFWLNVPVGIFLVPASLLRLPESFGPRPRLDVRGLVLIGAGLFALTWAGVRAPSVGWGSAEVVSMLIIGVRLVAAFLAWERRAPHPMLPLAYFRLRDFSTANGVIFFQFLSLLGALFLMTQLFQIGLSYSPFAAGLRILAWMATPMLIAPIAGLLADRFGNRPFMLAGLLLQAVGLAWVASLVHPGVGYGELVVPLAIGGVGTSMCFPTVANAVTASVPPEDVSVATGTNVALRELGGVFGIAIAAAVFARNGSYADQASFIKGFKPALTTSAALAAVGVVAAVLAPGKKKAQAPGEAGVSETVDEAVLVGPES
jgi:MFS family permease